MQASSIFADHFLVDVRQDVKLDQLIEESYPRVDRETLKVGLMIDYCIFTVKVRFVVLIGEQEFRPDLVEKCSLNLQHLDALRVVGINAVVEGIAVIALETFDELKS